MGKFVAEIPLPVGEKGLARLDTSEIGIDVVEQVGVSWLEVPVRSVRSGWGFHQPGDPDMK